MPIWKTQKDTGEMEVFCIVIVVVITQLYILGKAQPTVHF